MLPQLSQDWRVSIPHKVHMIASPEERADVVLDARRAANVAENNDKRAPGGRCESVCEYNGDGDGKEGDGERQRHAEV